MRRLPLHPHRKAKRILTLWLSGSWVLEKVALLVLLRLHLSNGRRLPERLRERGGQPRESAQAVLHR